MRRVILSVLCMISFIMSVNTVSYAAETTLKIDTVSCYCQETVDVPIIISGNTGIAGAVIKISYDTQLELVAINQGDAFESLTYTPPAKLTSNPFTLLWDGIDGDNSNGTIAILTFKAPKETGTYNISASYETGGIYDGGLNDINVILKSGAITALEKPTISVSITDKTDVKVELDGEIQGMVYVALYDDKSLLEVQSHSAKKIIETNFENINSAKYIKAFWWNPQTLMPYCVEGIVNL